MNPLRTRLVQYMLPIVILALMVVGAVSVGMTAWGGWIAGTSWTRSMALVVPSHLTSASAEIRLRAAHVAHRWEVAPDDLQLQPGEGVVLWREDGQLIRDQMPEALHGMQLPELQPGVHLVTGSGGAWVVVVSELPAPYRAMGLLSPVGDGLADAISSLCNLEVAIALGDRVLGSSSVARDGTRPPITLPDELLAWTRRHEREEPVFSGAATLTIPQYRGRYPEEQLKSLKGSDQVPARDRSLSTSKTGGPPASASARGSATSASAEVPRRSP